MKPQHTTLMVTVIAVGSTLFLGLYFMSQTAGGDEAGISGKASHTLQYTNRLIHEKSPYLLQHAHNPVDWYPWGPEAFQKAKAEDKPIFLSVGYSTCHWCHVMERESFENLETAKIMNENFVCIKVDREERPDVDKVYMTFVQATTGGGGWPMSVWLTPDLKPISGGTYFPPEDRFGRPGFRGILERIAAAWKSNRDALVSQGNQVVRQMQTYFASAKPEKADLEPQILQSAYEAIKDGYDPKEGGFGRAPKFPRPVTLNFLLRYMALKGRDSAEGKKALEMVLFTLDKMARGGMHDQLGGGFHRYSVDAYWHVPHFEKMLYDQAQLAISYLEAFQITGEDRFARVARDILKYVQRDMTDDAGGFYSAEDADSLFERGKPEHGEGAFYLWTRQQIVDVLGQEAAEPFDYVYGVEANGNAPRESDPQGEFRGKNILIQRHGVEEAAKKFHAPAAQLAEHLAGNRRKLFTEREKRPRPRRDDKIITAWNGLMISAFARAYQVLHDRSYAESAVKAASFLHQALYDGQRARLHRNYRQSVSEVEGFLSDYAFLIQGLLDLYEASLDVRWLAWAGTLQETQDDLFWDNEFGAYFSTSGGDDSILLRMKDDYDGAEPSPNSVAMLNLLRLAQMTDSEEEARRARKALAYFSQAMSKQPTSVPQMLVALDYSLSKPKQIVLAGRSGSTGLEAMLTEVNDRFMPHKILLLADQGEGQAYLGRHLEFIRDVQMIDGKATAYVCEDYTCKLPTNDLRQFETLLDAD